MENTPNMRRSTRSAGAPAVQSVAPTNMIKQEAFDDYGARGQIRQPIIGSFQEPTSSNSNDDPLAVEMDIGNTGITFQDAFFNVQGDYIKHESLAPDEIDDSGEPVGSSTKRRRNTNETDSGDDSGLSRNVQQSASLGRIMFHADHAPNASMNDAGGSSSNSIPPRSSSPTINGQSGTDTYVIKVLNNHSNVATEQAQSPKERLKVLTPTILNSNMNAKYPVVHTAGSTQTAANQGRAHGAAKTANCTHCACFDKFVSDHNRKVDQFLVKQQKVVNDMFKLQRAIMERLQSIEGNLERQTTQLQQASVSEQPDESPQTPIHPNDFVQLQYVAHHRTPPEEQQNEPQHHHHHQLGEYPDEVQLFSFTRMQSEEELNEFEKRLGDSEYFKEAYNWLNSLIMETNCGNRMLAALDLMFDKVFVNQCSWTGRCKGNARKAPIRCRRNLLQLFKAIGSTRKAIVSRADVEVFFIKKLKQSKQRLNIQGVRKSTCHMKRVHVD